MKRFYAQNTVESLLTDEQRNAQIENLRTYDNEYFNTGIKDGLNNIANQTLNTFLVLILLDFLVFLS